VDRTGNDLAPAFYVIVAAGITFGTILTMRETANRPLPKLVAAGAKL
jgi:MFS transporter, MHS family, proline/betaine transporter